MRYDVFDSPIGKITICTDGKVLTELHLQDDRYFQEIPLDWIHDAKNPLLQETKRELLAYFNRKQGNFEIPVRTYGTPFQKIVWKAIQQIPFGKTVTYKELAQTIGRPRAVRAVGTAVGRNVLCIIIPCHRIVASNGSLGGYVAGLKRKQQLLDLERA